MTIEFPKFSANQESAIIDRIKSFEPAFTESTLLNGAKFIAGRINDTTLATVAAHIDAGSRREMPGEHGILHFFEHLPPAGYRISNNGSSIINLIKKRGWGLNIQTDQDQLTFGFTCPDYDSPLAIKALGEILNYNDEILEQVFPVEKSRILSEISLGLMDAPRVNRTFIRELIMRGTGYAHSTIGTPEDVAAYTFQQVRDVGMRYLSAPNATLTVSGSAEVISSAYSACEGMAFPGYGDKAAVFDYSGMRSWEEIPRLSHHINSVSTGVQISLVMPGITSFNPTELSLYYKLLSELSGDLQQQLSFETGLTYDAGTTALVCGQRTFTQAYLNLAPESVPEAYDKLMEIINAFPEIYDGTFLKNAFHSALAEHYKNGMSRELSGELAYLARYPERYYISPGEELDILNALSSETLRTIIQKFFHAPSAKVVLHGSQEALDKVQFSI